MVEPDPQINREVEQLFADLLQITSGLNISTLLIGARSRIYILDSRFNAEGRKTTDWDVAVQLSNSDVYEQLVKQMTEITACFRKNPTNDYRFIHISTGIDLDIIPFGDIVTTLDKPVKLSLLGLQEVSQNAEITVINNLQISVPSVPAYLFLKLLTWYDRRETRDLQDIKFVLQTYKIDDEQIFQKLSNELADDQIKFDEASILLLGRAIHQSFGNENLVRVNQVIGYLIQNQRQFLSQLVSETEDWDAEFVKIVRWFEVLQMGINE